MNEKAFGWPAGSVTALLALITVVGAELGGVTLLGFLVFYREWQAAAAAAGVLGASASTVIAFYFGKSAGQASGVQAPPPASE